MSVYTNNVLLHPLRALKIALRRLLVNRDANDPLWNGGEVPPFLEPFGVGELLPWKGVSFKVGKVVGGDFPMVILVPVDRTHGEKLRTIRQYRDGARARRRATAAVADALAREAR